MSDPALASSSSVIEAPPVVVVEAPVAEAPVEIDPKAVPEPKHRRPHATPHVEWIRFDATSDAFAQVAGAYRKALARAERLHRLFEEAEEAGELSRARKIARKLAEVDEELDAARAAIQEHTRATAKKPMRDTARPARVTERAA